MLKLNRVVDYGILILSHMIREEEGGKEISSAKEISQANHLSQPMVSKILKTLVRAELIASVRGIRGGYALAPRVRELTLGDLIRKLDGPIRVTECAPTKNVDPESGCELHDLCSLRGTMLRVNQLVQQAFDAVTLAEVAGSRAAPPAPRGIPLPARPGRLLAPAPDDGPDHHGLQPAVVGCAHGSS